MGCVIEFLFELVYEVILEAVGHCYIKMMLWIVPTKTVTEKNEKAIKMVVTTIAAILMISVVVGVIFLAQEDVTLICIGRYMTYIPLVIIALQILLGITVKIIERIKK